MKKDDRRLMINLGVIFLAVALRYPLPHDSYSILQYIIRPIHLDSSILYPANIILLAMFIIGIYGVMTTERFRRHMRILGLIYILLIIIPLMNLTIDFARIAYYTAARGGVHSVDIKDSEISLSQVNGTTIIDVSLVLKSYSFYDNEFGIRVYLPEALSKYTGISCYEFEPKYHTHNYSNTLNVNQQIIIDTLNTEALYSFPPAKWQFEDVKYELFNDKSTVTVIRHGL